MATDLHAAIDNVYRSDWSRIVATLIRVTGDFDVAEEAVQDAFAAGDEPNGRAGGFRITAGLDQGNRAA